MTTENEGWPSDAGASAQISFEGDRRPHLLAPTLAIEMNLLSVPIAVLNTRAARASMRFVYEWRSEGKRALFAMNRPNAVAFPQIQHAEVFYTLLAMFAQRFNDEGNLCFRLIDVARNAGKYGDGGSVFTTIKEAVWRYSKCAVEWSESWEMKGGERRCHNWDGPLIIANDLFDTKEVLARKIKKNPRRSRQTEKWHSIIFHPLVVQSIKSQFVRVFLTEVLQSDLNDAAKCVYRYFYRFSDKSSVSRRYEHLMQAFPWNSGKTRFIVWLKTQLTELKERGVVESFELHQEGVVVRCTPVNRLKLVAAAEEDEGQVINIPSIDADEALLRRITELKKQGKLTDSAIKTLATIQATSGRSEAAKQLRLHLKGKA